MTSAQGGAGFWPADVKGGCQMRAEEEEEGTSVVNVVDILYGWALI